VNTTWYKLKDLAEERFGIIPKNPGVYFVRWSRGGRPVPIHRLGGCDDKGILYIGPSKRDLRRIREFWKAITEENAGQHTIFATLAFCDLSEFVRLNELEVSWEVSRSPEDAEVPGRFDGPLENLLIAIYHPYYNKGLRRLLKESIR
jgi:hypothetical protein